MKHLLDTECLTCYILRMRKNKIITGEYYHVFNRGNNKQVICSDQRDRARLLFLIIYFQSPINFYNLGRQTSYYVKHSVFNISEDLEKNVIKQRRVDLINFAIMPNHFHLTLIEIKEGGISQYMQRILNSYTKYFNTKYDKVGHLFQGPYKAVHINDNEQLLYLSTYIHRNPREIQEWKNKEEHYPWSSYQDYTKENRWGELLKREIVISQFLGKNKYSDFLKMSPAKKALDEELEELLIDK